MLGKKGYICLAKTTYTRTNIVYKLLGLYTSLNGSYKRVSLYDPNRGCCMGTDFQHLKPGPSGPLPCNLRHY